MTPTRRFVTDHARDRAVERLGRPLTEAEWVSIAAAILERRAVLLARDPVRGSETWAVMLGGVLIRALWKPMEATVVTILPDTNRDLQHGRLTRALQPGAAA